MNIHTDLEIRQQRLESKQAEMVKQMKKHGTHLLCGIKYTTHEKGSWVLNAWRKS